MIRKRERVLLLAKVDELLSEDPSVTLSKALQSLGLTQKNWESFSKHEPQTTALIAKERGTVARSNASRNLELISELLDLIEGHLKLGSSLQESLSMAGVEAQRFSSWRYLQRHKQRILDLSKKYRVPDRGNCLLISRRTGLTPAQVLDLHDSGTRWCPLHQWHKSFSIFDIESKKRVCIKCHPGAGLGPYDIGGWVRKNGGPSNQAWESANFSPPPGSMIRRWRLRSQLDQKNIAVHVGVTVSFLNSIENSRSTASPLIYIRMAALFGTDPPGLHQDPPQRVRVRPLLDQTEKKVSALKRYSTVLAGNFTRRQKGLRPRKLPRSPNLTYRSRDRLISRHLFLAAFDQQVHRQDLLHLLDPAPAPEFPPLVMATFEGRRAKPNHAWLVFQDGAVWEQHVDDC